MVMSDFDIQTQQLRSSDGAGSSGSALADAHNFDAHLPYSRQSN